MVAFAFNNRNFAIHAAVVFLVTFSIAILVLLSDMVFKSNFIATIQFWKDIEQTSLDQGNFLASISKFQRAIDKGGIVGGVAVFDLKTPRRSLVSLGNLSNNSHFEKLPKNYLFSEEPVVEGLFFDYTSYLTMPRSSHAIVVTTSPIFGYGVFGLGTAMLVLFLLMVGLISRKFQKRIDEMSNLNLKAKNDFNELMLNRFRQVAHDIRSPLSVIDIGISSPALATDLSIRECMKEASMRIMAIASDLLDSARDVKVNDFAVSDQIGVQAELMTLTSVNLAVSIRKIAIEKSIEFEGKARVDFECDFEDSVLVFARESDLHRIVSNIVNNAVESYEGSLREPRVTILLRAFSGNRFGISISDRGKGIPSHIQECLGSVNQLSYGKESSKGNGLAIFQAKRTLDLWGGSLTILSEVGFGTVVEVLLRKVDL